MNNELQYLEIRQRLEDEFDGKLNITPKNTWFLRTFTKANFGITLMYTIALPDSWESMSFTAKASMLMHEAQHVRQQLRLGMGNIYLGFLVQALLYIFMFFPVGFAYARARLEMEGYKETLRGYYLMNGRNLSVIDNESMRKHVIGQFTGPSYFYMWPYKKYMNRWYDRTLKEIVLEEG